METQTEKTMEHEMASRIVYRFMKDWGFPKLWIPSRGCTKHTGKFLGIYKAYMDRGILWGCIGFGVSQSKGCRTFWGHYSILGVYIGVTRQVGFRVGVLCGRFKVWV